MHRLPTDICLPNQLGDGIILPGRYTIEGNRHVSFFNAEDRRTRAQSLARNSRYQAEERMRQDYRIQEVTQLFLSEALEHIRNDYRAGGQWSVYETSSRPNRPVLDDFVRSNTYEIGARLTKLIAETFPGLKVEDCSYHNPDSYYKVSVRVTFTH
jgi:hypothetical protein